MFGLDFGEMLLLGAIALIALGPKQLPEVARTIGKFLNEIKRLTGDFTKTVIDARDNTNEKLTVEQEEQRRANSASHSASGSSSFSGGAGMKAPDGTVPSSMSTHENSSDVAEEQLSFDLEKDS
jgi:sec-independent protein translocase protein TatB